jgi:hypothetical protein
LCRPNVITRVLKSGRQKRIRERDVVKEEGPEKFDVASFEDGGRESVIKELRQPQHARKGEKMDASLVPPEKDTTANSSILAQQDLGQTSKYRTVLF